MSSSHSRISEAQIGIAVLRILSKRQGGEATVATIRKRLPSEVRLSLDDKEGSITRVHEELWEQQVRNIRSHKNTEGNPFHEGLLESPQRGSWRITELGKKYLNTL